MTSLSDAETRSLFEKTCVEHSRSGLNDQPVIGDPSRQIDRAASFDTHGDLGFIRQIDLQSMGRHREIGSRLRPVMVYNLLEVA